MIEARFEEAQDLSSQRGPGFLHNQGSFKSSFEGFYRLGGYCNGLLQGF